MTTKEDIRNWVERATPENTHMLIICDTFSHEDYPVFIIQEGETIQDLKNKYNKDMQKIMEIYNLKIDIEPQLNEYRSWNL